VPAERRHRDGGADAGHDRQQHAAAPCRVQRAAEDHDRQHRTKRELQPDRLVYQCQRRNDHAVGRTPRHRGRPGPSEGQRHGEHRQRRRAEQVGPGGIGGERDSEGQQRNEHRDHQPAFGSASREQHHTGNDREAPDVHRRRQPTQPEGHREPVAGDQTDQFTREAPPDEAEGVVDGVIRHPIHVERNDVDREAQHGGRPDRDGDGDADVQHRACTLGCFQAQVHHESRP